MTSQRTPDDSSVLDAVDTSGVPASVAIAAFNVAVYVALRYAPEYLRLLGNGPVLIGLFGTAATLLAVLYPSVAGILDRLGSNAVSLVGALAATGIACWLVAPQVGSGSDGRSITVLFVGLALVASWQAFGIDTAAVSAFVPRRVRSGLPSVIQHTKTPRYVAVLAGLPVVVGFLAAVSPALTAIQVVFGLAAAIGLTATVLLVVLDDFTTGIAADAASGSVAVGRGTSIRATLDVVRSLPRAIRQSLVGDTLVEFAVGMVSVFLVITVTSVLRIEVTLFGLHLRPDAYFAVCLFAEMAVALVATEPLALLARRIGRERVVAGIVLVGALFPVALVSVPANPTLIVVLFGLFGCYRAGLPVRRDYIDAITMGDAGDEDPYRTARAVVQVPSALVGGLLYAASPILAFGLATVIGTVGVRELLAGMR